MKDLRTVAGLPVQADVRTGRLELPAELCPGRPLARPLADLAPELLSPGARGPDPAAVAYPEVGEPALRASLAAAGLAYSLLVLPPGRVGREYIKTPGQREPGGCSRVYEALLGTALILCQRTEPAPADVVVVELEPGQKLAIPPGYGHVVINAGAQALVLASLGARSGAPDAAPFRARRGAGYYCLAGAGGEAEFVENTRYGGLPDLRMVPAEAQPEIGLQDGVPLYTAAAAPGRFAWVLDPGPVAAWLAFPELDDADLDDEEE